MQIEGSKILIFGGWGLVGSAICHKLMEHSPSQLIVSSLRQSEAEDAVEHLRKEYSDCDPNMFVPKWGNIFTRTEWKDDWWGDIIEDDQRRKGVVKDIFNELDEEIVKKSALYSLVEETKPDIVIDCVNTATAIAYLDIYNTTLNVVREIEENNIDSSDVEKLMTSSYIPQLIRHIQILNRALNDNKAKCYLKIGTSGTGGMGMNIPYTHSEERPSRVLLSKTAVAGAHSLLLFLLARTPEGPVVKEIKPTAAIAWKRIAYDKVKKGGKPIQMVDMPHEKARKVNGSFKFGDINDIEDLGEDYQSVFIDTGENGIFSKGEFEAISSLGQMEIVTPEEIAAYAVFELAGGNTGKDFIQGLDSFTLGPTYRGGLLQNSALDKIKALEKQHNIDSVAFELLGPPRLSKLLFEAFLIKKVAGSMSDAIYYQPEDLANEANKLIKFDAELRSEILSIGLVILLPDGNNYLRGKQVKIPVSRGKSEPELTRENVEQWCCEGWLDLRPSNFKEWQKRFKNIIEQANSIPEDETSSRFTYTKEYWQEFETIDEGKIAGWIFEFEDKGWRFKR